MIQYLFLFIYVLFLDFIGDWVLQTNKMAMNKSTSFGWLSIHCLVYYITLFFGLLLYPYLNHGFNYKDPIFVTFVIAFPLINSVFHFGVDSVTSQLTTKFYLSDNRRMFFITIGTDQLIHKIIIVIFFFLYLCDGKLIK